MYAKLHATYGFKDNVKYLHRTRTERALIERESAKKKQIGLIRITILTKSLLPIDAYTHLILHFHMYFS